MIEAVNSVLSNASLTRGATAQPSAERIVSANPEKVQERAQAPYVSPYISVDKASNRAVLQIRDSDTGDVVRQFPTEGQLKAYRTAQNFVDKAESSNPRVVVDTTTPAPAAPQQSAPAEPTGAPAQPPAPTTASVSTQV